MARSWLEIVGDGALVWRVGRERRTIRQLLVVTRRLAPGRWCKATAAVTGHVSNTRAIEAD